MQNRRQVIYLTEKEEAARIDRHKGRNVRFEKIAGKSGEKPDSESTVTTYHATPEEHEKFSEFQCIILLWGEDKYLLGSPENMGVKPEDIEHLFVEKPFRVA